MNFKRTWSDSHRGINYEICHHGVSEYMPNGIWNYYIYIRENQTDKFDEIYSAGEVKEWSSGGSKYVDYDYYNIPYINEADFHGGITFYESGGKTSRYVKIGCDYSHYYDTGLYDENYIQNDAIETIDELIKLLEIK
jgi:hypothetical protein